MDKSPFDSKEVITQCRRYIRVNRGCDANKFMVLRDAGGKDTQFAVRIAENLETDIVMYDYTMMQALKSSTQSTRFTIPTRYDIIQDGIYDYHVMEKLEGPTIWQVMGNGSKELSDDYANKIAIAVTDLRGNQRFCDSFLDIDALTPLVHCYPQGPIFPYDNEGGRVVSGKQDFMNFMTTRFQDARINLDDVPLAPFVLTHGGLSPHNLKLCPDGTIGFMDLRTSFMAPAWWEYYAVHVSPESPMFAKPLKKAMIRNGISASSKIISELSNKFRPWFASFGEHWAHSDREELAATGAPQC